MTWIPISHLSLSSIFVTPEGNWKLGGLEDVEYVLKNSKLHTVSAQIGGRWLIKKLRFYGEILLNKMLSNWQILLNKVLAWRFNQEWPLICADTVVSSLRQNLNFKVQMLAANKLISYPSDSLEENLTLVGNHGRPAG